MKTKTNSRLHYWQQKAKSGTEKCRCGETRNLNVDHVVPVAILTQFMLDQRYVLYEMDENFEILCRYCNSMKADRIDPRNPKTYEILEKVIRDAKNYYLI